MTVTTDLEPLEIALGRRFQDRTFLEQALTHASIDSGGSYERLEFLGDRVLGLVVAQMLLDKFPDEDEGQIGRRFAALVNAGSLSRIGVELGIAGHIRAGAGVINESIIADVIEALIAALFCDGGLAAAEAFVRRIWSPLIEMGSKPPQDPKTALQEWAQAGGRGLPNYRDVARDGPDHAPSFTVEVCIDGEPPAQAKGSSKRSAEREAAAIMLGMLGLEHNE
ncbi:MAG: ribonuclease III [Alphaproteobacteria bacterium]|nr:ribonuclease III [Alphaproteobacteria bacterium]HCP00501.1 ribonuclease III [Rhodospirillaceae bacterium]